jgi:glycosyltransferase involved in cell wall biosynthesis
VGFVVNPDTAEISEAIERFYQENKEESFTKQIKVEKLKYSWERMVEVIEHLIRKTDQNDIS